MKQKTKPICHPNRRHHAKGLCQYCYNKNRGLKSKHVPGYSTAYGYKWKLENKYKISMEQYEKMLQDQGERCAICRNLFKGKRRPAVDHNHITGRVRGLLCSTCNMKLGALEDWVWRAAADAYLMNKTGTALAKDQLEEHFSRYNKK